MRYREMHTGGVNVRKLLAPQLPLKGSDESWLVTELNIRIYWSRTALSVCKV